MMKRKTYIKKINTDGEPLDTNRLNLAPEAVLVKNSCISTCLK